VSDPSQTTAPTGLLVNIDVDDLERATRFYTEALGLRVGRRFRERWIELLGGSSPIYLLEKPSDSRATESTSVTRSYARHWTPVHMDFVVASLELSLDLALRAGAVLESGIAEHPYGRIAMFSDPFGHGFCLIEMSREGYDAPGL
jgi:predicted enzyme related to lactoylglutathione lyase